MDKIASTAVTGMVMLTGLAGAWTCRAQLDRGRTHPTST